MGMAKTGKALGSASLPEDDGDTKQAQGTPQTAEVAGGDAEASAPQQPQPSGGADAEASAEATTQTVTTTVRHVAKRAVAKATGGVSAVAGRIARFLGVPQAAGVAILLACVLACGGSAWALWSGGMSAERLAALVSDDDDCVAVVQAKQAKYGKGERQIPETQTVDGTTYTIGKVATWENDPNRIKWASGTAQRAVYNAWVANGSVTDSAGYARMGSGDDAPYIIAVSDAAFGMTETTRAFVGEQLTVYFDNGEGIECIIGDTKASPSKAEPGNLDVINYETGNSGTGWGHIVGNQVAVLEFWGINSTNPYKGLKDLEGHRCDSFTPEGLAASVKNAAGWNDSFMSGAGDGKTASATSTVKQAMGECRSARKKLSADNSDIARAAVTFAWPTSRQAGNNNGTELYQEVVDGVKALGGQNNSSCPYMDCGVVVSTAVLWSGSDDTFCSLTPNEQAHMIQSDRWEDLGVYGSDITKEGLEPGDVFVTDHAHGVGSGHTFLYVGEDLIKEIHGSEALPHENSVSGSLGERSAGCDFSADGFKGIYDGLGRFYRVYRCVNPQHSSKFTSVAGGSGGSNG